MKVTLPFNAHNGTRPVSVHPVFLCLIGSSRMANGFARYFNLLLAVAVAVGLCSTTGLSAELLYEHMEVIAQYENSLTIEYSLDDDDILMAGDNRSVSHINGVKYISLDSSSMIPVSPLLIGVPASSSVSWEIIATEWYQDSPTPGHDLVASNDLIEIRPQTRIRSQTIQPINIYPLVKNAGGRSLLRRLVLRIAIEDERSVTSKPVVVDEGSFERLLSGILLNYRQARSWRSKPQAEISLASQDNVFGQFSNWIKIEVNSSGIYQVTASQLTSAGVNLAEVDPRNFRLFWGGGKPLPVSLEESRPELREMAVYVSGEADGNFDSADRMIFYAPGASYPYFDQSESEMQYSKHPYTYFNVYYLTYDAGGSAPLRMETISSAPDGSEVEVTTFDDYKRFEQDLFLSEYRGHLYDYFHWYWIDDDDLEQFINLENIDVTATNRLTIGYIGSSPAVFVNGFEAETEYVSDYRGVATFNSNAFTSGSNRLSIQIDGNIRDDHMLDYINLEYTRYLRMPESGSYLFYGRRIPGSYKYVIENISASTAYLLLDVSDMYDQKVLNGFDINQSQNLLEFALDNQSGEFSRFVIADGSALSEPVALTKVEVADLKSPGASHDLIVIAPEEFMSAFETYRDMRGAEGYDVFLADIEDVYATFSGGMIDPIAIRDFLKYAFENWPAPKPGFVILGGDGTYDFLNLKSTTQNYVPPYIVAEDSTNSDENYILFHPGKWLDSDSTYPADRGVDMIISRWPVRSSAEVAQYTAKLSDYVSGEFNGSWQNRITFVADDELKNNASPLSERIHTIQSEQLANAFTPSRYNRNKIYLIDYPLDSRSEKPGAKADLIESINEGTVLVNYIGHGNPRVWTDEHIFRNEDISSLSNRDKLPVIFTASCSIGEFDSPYSEGMAELLFRAVDGGAIAVVAATRLVFSRQNFDYNSMAFNVIFSGEDYSLAEEVYVAKLLRQIQSGTKENDRKYVMFGDPLMKVKFPSYNIRFNTGELDSLSALQLATISGTVEDDYGVTIGDFNGEVEVSVYDNQQEKVYRLSGVDDEYSINYTSPGARLFRGMTTASGGEFELRFVVPKDISYGGQNARIAAFALSSTDKMSASGALDSIVISGSAGEITDTLAPEIEVLRQDQPLAGNTLLRPGDQLTVELFDSSGINLSGEVGHRIEVSFNDDPKYMFDLTDDFIYNPGSYQKGEVIFTVPDIDDGNYSLKIKAWDSANNSALKEFDISIGNLRGQAILDLFNVPNPFVLKTQFVYELSFEADQVALEVFTLGGRKIHTLKNLPGRIGENITDFYNGTDRFGDKLANGIYIYKLSVTGTGSSSDKTVEKFGKFVILR